MDSKLNTPRSTLNYSVAVSDLYGNDTNVSILSPDIQIEKIKETAIKQLLENESSSNFNQFRLILIRDEPRLLCDDKTVKQELIEDGDCAILLKSRSKPVSSLVKDGVVSHDGPTQSAINRATEALPDFTNITDKNKTQQTDLSSHSQVEQTFRKVLLALLDLSYKFMHFEENDAEETSNNIEVDSDSLKSLMEMGFPEKRVRKALQLNNMDKNSAMEWLLSHSGAESDDEDTNTADEPMDTGMVKIKPKKRFKPRPRAFVPNPTHLQSLLDMGFSEEQSVRAMRLYGNDTAAACDWLLSDHANDDVEEDNDEPLSPDSELYKALLSNPTIHIGLHDKKVLEALEDMVENPWRRNNWAYESAVGNVLLQILKLYNKYSTTSQS